MLKLIAPLPKQITVAFSGGVDSVAAVDFLSRKHDVTCAFFHHGTENSNSAIQFAMKFCADRNLSLIYGILSNKKTSDLSQEEFWRIERYNFLSTLGTVVTAHHLDDCVETYIWSALHGKPTIPKIHRGNVIRPFLTTPKSKFIDWCVRKNIQWCEDTSNSDEKYTRNYIRKNLIPHALKVNPGLSKVVKKIIEQNMIIDRLKK